MTLPDDLAPFLAGSDSVTTSAAAGTLPQPQGSYYDAGNPFLMHLPMGMAVLTAAPVQVNAPTEHPLTGMPMTTQGVMLTLRAMGTTLSVVISPDEARVWARTVKRAADDCSGLLVPSKR